MAVIKFSGRRQSRVEGIEETRRVFAQLSPVAIGRITNALNLGAEEIKVTAKALAPKDTGELAGAIEVRRSLEGFSARGIIGAFHVAAGGGAAQTSVERFIGVFPERKNSPGWYAAFVEFGTASRTKGKVYKTGSKRRKKKARDTHPGTTAQPFLFPAFWALRKRVKGRITRELNRGFKEFVARNSRRRAA